MLNDPKQTYKPLLSRRRDLGHLTLILGMLMFLSLLLPNETFAANHPPNRHIAKNTVTISTEEAIQIAKQGRKVRVLKVSKQILGNKQLYRVKLITQKGLVQTVLIDASTGKRVRRK